MLRFFLSQRLPNGTFTRREWLRLGGLAGFGLRGAAGTRARADGPHSGRGAGFGRAKSVLLVYTSGGQSQLDTWDPKPDAPEGIRGEFRSVPTAVPGLRLCEHMPRLAALADRYTVVRSVTHQDGDHGSATYLSLTGQYHARLTSNPPVDPANDLPTYGSVVHRVRPARGLPFSAVHVNGPLVIPRLVSPGQFAGRLGVNYQPPVVEDPTQGVAGLFALGEREDLPPARQGVRRSLLETIDHAAATLSGNRAALDMDVHYRQAYEFLASPRGRRAFDLGREPERVRERYGRHRSGQACLLGRRLVEAGVPWVTVFWNHNCRGQDATPDATDEYGWDTHNDIFAALKDRLLPRFDQSFAALLEDLEQRGLLDQTLVVCLGEFGRHPQVAKEPSFAGDAPGRRHWPFCYSAVLAGAGVGRGALYGSSDRTAAYPRTDPVGPWDLAATMFHALGIDPAAHYRDVSERPFPVTTGRPILGLFG